MAKKKTAKTAKKRPRSSRKASSAQRSRRSVDDVIADLKTKIGDLERQKAIRSLSKEPVFRHLRATLRSLEKAVSLMDGRSGILEPEFIRASRQYVALLDRALEEATGVRRRGRKPSYDLSG